jgi:hypothetical protein
MRAFTPAASVAVRHESPLEPRLHDRNKRMVHDSIGKWSCTDEAQLGLLNPKRVIATWSPCPLAQAPRKLKTTRLQLKQELRHGCVSPLATRRSAGTPQ